MSPIRSSGESTSETNRPNSSSSPYTVSGSAWANGGSFANAARSARFSSAKRMSFCGATYSLTEVEATSFAVCSREACARNVDANPFESPAAQLPCLLGIQSLAREDVQRAAIVIAEHARDREAVAGGHAGHDVTALAHPDAFVGAGRRDPHAVLGVQADAVREPSAITEVGPHAPV